MAARFKLSLVTLFLFCLTNSLIVNTVYYGLNNLLISFIFLFAILDLISDNKKNRFSILFAFLLVLFFFILIQYFYLNIKSFQVQLGIYRLLIIPFMAFYFVYLSRSDGFIIIKYLLPVFIFNVLIVYWRVFFDYTFFGLVKIVNFDNISEQFAFGLELWRPSNLESPIVFAIELVSFILLYYYYMGSDKKTRIVFSVFVILSVIPLLVMRSRSSFIIIIGSILLNNLGHKLNLKKLFYLCTFLFLLLFLSPFIDLVSVLSFTDDSYSERSSSLFNTITTFINSPVVNLFFGYGSGHSNFELEENSGFNIYVENYFASFLIDYGLILTLPFVILNLWYFIRGIFNLRNILFLSFSLLILVNLFSSNLSAYSLSFFYWVSIFKLYYSNVKKKI